MICSIGNWDNLLRELVMFTDKNGTLERSMTTYGFSGYDENGKR